MRKAQHITYTRDKKKQAKQWRRNLIEAENAMQIKTRVNTYYS